MIQRLKKNPVTGDAVFPLVKSNSIHRSNQARCWRLLLLQNGVLLLRLPGKGCSHHENVCLTSQQTEGGLVSKLQGKFSKAILFLQDNAAPQKDTTNQKLAVVHFEVLKQQACSPHLAPSDFYVFPNVKKHLKVRKISSLEEDTLAADGWFAAQEGV
jgi:hypothetical protein